MSAIQKAVNWAVELAVEIAKDLEDKKLTIPEAIGLWDNAFGLIDVIRSVKDIPTEWEVYKDDEQFWSQVTMEVKKRLSFDNPLIDKLVLQIVKTGIEIKSLVLISVDVHNQIKALKKK